MPPKALRVLVFVFLAVAGLAPAGLRAEDARPVAVAAHLSEEGESARLSFDLSAPIEAAARPISDPDRILIDIPEVNFQIDPAVGRAGAAKSGGLVKMFRFGLISPGQSRVVIELARPACVTKVETRPIAKGEAPFAADRRVQGLRRRRPSPLPPRPRYRPRPRRGRPAPRPRRRRARRSS